MSYVSTLERRSDAMATYAVTLIGGEDGYIVAECPSLPGCVSQGKTREEAMANITEAIEGILEVRKELGEPVIRPEVRFVNIPT